MTTQILKDLRMGHDDDLMNDDMEETDTGSETESLDDITTDEDEEEEF